MDGIINVYKEKGFTSHDVVAKLRGILKQKKIGHTGTLDPDAVGVLPVCFGKATKVCDMLTNKDKVYEAVMQFGVVTDTQDLSGQVLERREVRFSEEELEQMLAKFIGVQKQIPPMYSALKVNGRKLYELAREGKIIERKPRDIEIYQMECTSVQLDKSECTVIVHCSKGTYIRTLCHDIGQALGCGAVMKDLKRISVSDFRLEDAKTLSEIEELFINGTLKEMIHPIDFVFQSYPRGDIEVSGEKLLKNGNALKEQHVKLTADLHPGTKVRIYNLQGRFAAIYEYMGKSGYKVVKMFS